MPLLKRCIAVKMYCSIASVERYVMRSSKMSRRNLQILILIAKQKQIISLFPFVFATLLLPSSLEPISIGSVVKLSFANDYTLYNHNIQLFWELKIDFCRLQTHFACLHHMRCVALVEKRKNIFCHFFLYFPLMASYYLSKCNPLKI